MPYKIRKVDSEYCVFNEDTGENKGCSDSKKKATSHMRALYFAEGKKSKEISDLIQQNLYELGEEDDEKSVFVEESSYISYVGWATSYKQMFEEQKARERELRVNDLTAQFPLLVGNIMADPTIEDKAKAVNDLSAELSSLIFASSEEYEIKETAVSEESIVSKVINRLKEVFSTSEDNSDGDFMTWKEADGEWRWIARYSNTFRDRDNPPEIISSKSHRRFVELVDKGLAPYPELWIWHVKDWKVGVSDWVAYDETSEDSGFAVASGYFLPGFEQVAEWLSKQKGVSVSHGMPESSIARDELDPTIINEHITREISPLPSWSAANTLTGFVSFKEVDMAIPKSKREAAKKWGMSDDLLDQIERMNQEDSEKAIDEGVQTKEENTESAEVQIAEEIRETSPEQATEQVQAEETPSSEETTDSGEPEEIKESEVSLDSLRNEVAEVVKAISNIVSELNAKIDVLSSDVANIKSNGEQTVEKGTPRASLLSMLVNSAIGDESNLVDGRTKLANSKPKETAHTEQLTGIPFIDEMLQGK